MPIPLTFCPHIMFRIADKFSKRGYEPRSETPPHSCRRRPFDLESFADNLLHKYQIFGRSQIGKSADDFPHASLKKSGCYRWAAHPSTRALLLWSYVSKSRALFEERGCDWLVVTVNNINGRIELSYPNHF